MIHILYTILIFTLFFSANASANMSIEEAFNYQQKGLRLQDSESDMALLKRTERAQANIIRILTGRNPLITIGKAFDDWGHEDERSIEEEIRLEGWSNPYHRDNFINMFLQVMIEERENGIGPSEGSFHNWADDTKRNNRLNLVVKYDKILVALAMGITNQVMNTGQEENLKNFLLTREDRSIPFHEFFRAAYKLNNGNVYLSLLTMENILSVNWKAPFRHNISYFKKLMPIHSHYNGGGDVYGSYYHFIGIMLYGYVKGGIAARFVGLTEAAGSTVLSRFESEVQENLANYKGGIIGTHLRKALKKNKLKNFKPDTNHLIISNYLKHDEDFRDRLPLNALSTTLSLKIKREVHNTGYLTAEIKNSGTTLYNCQIILFSKSSKKGRTRRYEIQASLYQNKSFSFEFNHPTSNPHARVIVSDCLDSEFSEATQTSSY